MELRKFSGPEIVLNQQQAWQVLVFFFGGNAGAVPGWLTDNDRSFAQALLVEAVDASYQISWIQTLMTSALTPNPSITGILAHLALKAGRDWLQSRNPANFKDAKIYKMVKDQLTLNWRSAWQIRIDTGDPVY
jgi:hypothetical protein